MSPYSSWYEAQIQIHEHARVDAAWSICNQVTYELIGRVELVLLLPLELAVFRQVARLVKSTAEDRMFFDRPE